MALLTDLTILPTFDQAKKTKKQKNKKTNLEKINWGIGENKFEKRSHKCDTDLFLIFMFYPPGYSVATL